MTTEVIHVVMNNNLMVLFRGGKKGTNEKAL